MINQNLSRLSNVGQQYCIFLKILKMKQCKHHIHKIYKQTSQLFRESKMYKYIQTIIPIYHETNKTVTEVIISTVKLILLLYLMMVK